MELTVENFRGARHAVIDLHPKITLLAGPVGSCKTSVIQALQALVTGETIPVAGVKKKDADCLVHAKEKSGRASLDWDGVAAAEVKWPACKRTGPDFRCSRYAAGLSLPAAIPPKELAEIFGIMPTKGDFDAEMDRLGKKGPVGDQLWKLIERNGWDGQHLLTKQAGTELKRQWESYAGEAWGSQKMLDWKPEHYAAGKSEADLTAALAAAEKIHEHSIRAAALNEKERDELQALANNKESAAKAVKDLDSQKASLRAEIAKAEQLLPTIPEAMNPLKAANCYNCGALGMWRNGEFVKAPEPAAQADIDAAKKRRQEQEQAIAALREKDREALVEWNRANDYLQKCENADRKLKNVVPVEEPPAVSAEDAKAEIELCRKRLAALQAKTECDLVAELIPQNLALCEVLAPEGLRKRVLAKRLNDFNAMLAELCEIAEWPRIEADEALDLYMARKPYGLLSTGEQFAVNAALQVALAKLDGSQILIMDCLYVVDSVILNGLIAILDAAGVPSVVAYTFSRKEAVPDLGDLGSEYWCEGGVVAALNATPQPA